MPRLRKQYSLATARAVALHAQGLHRPPVDPPTTATMEAAIERVLCLQIDTLQMVHRSHYLVLWSRIGNYQTADLDRLVFGSGDPAHNDRRMFEYWLKEACIIPLKDYRYSLPSKRWRKEENRTWWQIWVADQVNADLLAHVQDRIRAEGGLRTSDFEHKRDQRGSWWDWKPAKIALEHLYNTGELMIANRVNFQRVYDYTDHVLPAWVDTSEPTMEERHRYYIERSVRAHGVCDPLQAADYTHSRRNATKSALQSLIAEGVLLPINVELVDGKLHEYVIHRDDVTTLRQAADGALIPSLTTFLSPFDSLFWGRNRDEELFGFDQRIECYTPEPKRIWGYFSLPILHNDRLVGRFDPKLERKTGHLRIKALHLEPEVSPSDELAVAIAQTMRGFMAFHKATEVTIERSTPIGFDQTVSKYL